MNLPRNLLIRASKFLTTLTSRLQQSQINGQPQNTSVTCMLMMQDGEEASRGLVAMWSHCSWLDCPSIPSWSAADAGCHRPTRAPGQPPSRTDTRASPHRTQPRGRRYATSTLLRPAAATEATHTDRPLAAETSGRYCPAETSGRYCPQLETP